LTATDNLDWNVDVTDPDDSVAHIRSVVSRLEQLRRLKWFAKKFLAHRDAKSKLLVVNNHGLPLSDKAIRLLYRISAETINVIINNRHCSSLRPWSFAAVHLKHYGVEYHMIADNLDACFEVIRRRRK
jgi:hypothetical protein